MVVMHYLYIIVESISQRILHMILSEIYVLLFFIEIDIFLENEIRKLKKKLPR